VLPLNGGEPDFPMGASAATFEAINQAPAFYGARHNGGHSATYFHPGGEFANVASNWLLWTFKGEKEAANPSRASRPERGRGIVQPLRSLAAAACRAGRNQSCRASILSLGTFASAPFGRSPPFVQILSQRAFPEMKKSGAFEIRSFVHRQMVVTRELSYDERACTSASGKKPV
jgi:hypothetical protein